MEGRISRSVELARYLNGCGANECLRKFLMDAKLYMGAEQSAQEFAMAWFAGKVKGMARRRSAAEDDEMIRKKTFALVTELMEAAFVQRRQDFRKFACEFVASFRQEESIQEEGEEQKEGKRNETDEKELCAILCLQNDQWERGCRVDKHQYEEPSEEDFLIIMEKDRAQLCRWLPRKVSEEDERRGSFVMDQNKGVVVKFNMPSGTVLPEPSEQILRFLFPEAVRVEATLLQGGFSGAVVLRLNSWTDKQNQDEPTVVKIDAYDRLKSEVTRMESAIPYLGENSPSILGFCQVRGFAGMKIQLCGACWTLPEFMGDSSTMTTFKNLYCTQGNGASGASPRLALDIEDDVIGNVFGEVLGDAYSKTRQAQYVRLHEEYGMGKPIAKAIAWLETWTEEDDGLLLNEFHDILPKYLRSKQDIIKFLERFDRESKAWPEELVFCGLNHCDLNGANILVDSMGVCWIIDFAQFGHSHIVRDLAKLESCLLFEYTPINSLDELKTLVSLTKSFAFDVSNLEFCSNSELVGVVHRLRSFVHFYMADDQGILCGNFQQYNFALLFHSLDILKYRDVNHFGKLWALLFSIIHCQVLLKSHSTSRKSLFQKKEETNKCDQPSKRNLEMNFENQRNKYVQSMKMKHSNYTDAVTCKLYRVDTDFRPNAEVIFPEDDVSEYSDSSSVFSFDNGIVPSRMGIFAPNGLGKTVLMSQMILQLINCTNFIPIYIPIIDLIEKVDIYAEQDVLEAYLQKRFGKYSLRKQMLTKSRNEGRIVIFCDGLTQAGDRAKVLLRKLLGLTHTYKQDGSIINTDTDDSEISGNSSGATSGDDEEDGSNEMTRRRSVRVIFNSRMIDPDTMEKLVTKNKTIVCKLHELDTDQINAIVKSRFDDPSEAFLQTYMLELCQSPNYKRFCTNPLTLNLLLCYYMRNGKSTPNPVRDRMDLLENWIKFMMAPLRASLNHGLYLGIRALLGNLAHTARLRNDHGFTIDDILQALAENLNFSRIQFHIVDPDTGKDMWVRTDDFVTTLNLLFSSVKRDSSPLLRCVNRSESLQNRRYGFVQTQIEEYLMASHVLNTCSTITDLESLFSTLLIHCSNSVGQEQVNRGRYLAEKLKEKITSRTLRMKLQHALNLMEDLFRQYVTGNYSILAQKEFLQAVKEVDIQSAGNKKRLAELTQIVERLQHFKQFSMVDQEHGFLALLIEMLPEDLVKPLLFQVLPKRVLEEMFCVWSGSEDGAYTKTLQILMDFGVSPNSISPRTSWSALMNAAACYGHFDRVAMLLKYGAQVEYATPDEARSALYESCRAGNLDCVKLLVERGGADVNQTKSKGYSCLLAACSNGHAEIVRYLLEKGANIKQKSESGATAYYLAVKSGNVEVLQVLLEFTKDRNVLSNHRVMLGKREELTLLATACKFSKYKVTQWLLDEHHVDPNEPFKMNGQQLFCVWLAAKFNGVRSLKSLLCHNAALSHVDSGSGLNPLLVAALHGRSRTVEFLLSQDNMDLTCRSFNDDTAIGLAMKKPYINVSRVLFEFAKKYPEKAALLFPPTSKELLMHLSLAKYQEKSITAMQLVFDYYRTEDTVEPEILRNFASKGNTKAVQYLFVKFPKLQSEQNLAMLLQLAVLAHDPAMMTLVVNYWPAKPSETLANALQDSIHILHATKKSDDKSEITRQLALLERNFFN